MLQFLLGMTVRHATRAFYLQRHSIATDYLILVSISLWLKKKGTLKRTFESGDHATERTDMA